MIYSYILQSRWRWYPLYGTTLPMWTQLPGMLTKLRRRRDNPNIPVGIRTSANLLWTSSVSVSSNNSNTRLFSIFTFSQRLTRNNNSNARKFHSSRKIGPFSSSSSNNNNKSYNLR